MVQRVDKDSLKLDQPRRTPGHPTKSHIVKTKIDGKEKILRFGEQGAETAGKPKEGESERMKDKRASFKSRHAKNIAKGKSSPAYWANKVKWAEGGPVTGMAVGGGWGQMAAAGPVGGSAKAAADREKERAKEAYGQAAASMKQAGVTGIGGGAKPADRPGDMRERTFAGDLGNLIELYGVDDDDDDISPDLRAYLSSPIGAVAEPPIGPMPAPSVIRVSPIGGSVAPVSQPSQPAQPAGFFGQLMALPGAIGRDLKMGYQAGLFRGRDTQRENLMGAGYTPAQINDYFARTDATLARNAAEAAMRGDRDSVMQPMSNYEDLARGFAQEYNIVGRNRAQLMPLLEAFLRGRGILDPSTYSENIFNTLSIPMQRGGSVDLHEMYRKYADGGAVLSPDDPFYVPPETGIAPGTADEIRARALANRQRMAEEDTFGDTAAAMASGPWQEAVRRMSIAGSREGVAGLFPEAQNPYLRALQSAQGYIGDVGLAGLSAAEAGAAGLGGLIAEAVPQGLIERLPGAVRRSPADFERKLAEELVYGIPESMAGMAGGRALTALDEAIESARMAPTGAMMELDRMLEAYDPNVLGSNLGNIGGAPRAPRLVSPEERNVISTGAKRGNVTAVTDQVAAQKMSYPSADGWAQGEMQVTKVKPKKDKYEIVYKEVPYGFEKPPENMSPAQWQQEMVGREVDEIRKLAQRAKSGDQAAIDIIKQANWYRGIRNTLRSELGGLGDVFADVLGATSAQTGVELNWRNAVEIMRRFSRGEYDDEIRMYQEMLDKGSVNPTALQKMHKDPNNPFKLITSSAGALFNANSPAATKALFDMFRVAKGAPKTPNFTGNLIGYTNAATVDIWDARHLRRLAGLPRLPPLVEKGVTGGHLKGSTLEAPRIGGEFGFGQAVKRDAAKIINEEGIIRDVAPQFEDMNPDDLQAVAWFLEKELWTRNGWTNKAGEGGSFEYEAALAGAESPEAVNALRRQLNETFKPPPQRKRETDEQYAQRVAGEQEAFNARQAVAQDELDAMKAPFARYVLGISVERPDVRPTNVRQAEIAAQLGEPAKIDPNVVMYQINNTYGRFMQSDERAFNAEFVVRKNFDPTNVTRRMVEVAKQADQDAAFISKVMPQRTETSRPGVEIYFRKRQSPEFARTLSDKLTEYGVDGFTFVTDNRVMDRPGAQAGLEGEAIAGINGLRFQYIPEFDIGREAWEAMSPEEKAAKIDEIEELYDDIARDIVKTEPGISAANLMYYDTNVIDRERYDDFLK